MLKRLAVGAIALGAGAGLWPAAAAHATTWKAGYVWADRPTAGSYTPDGFFQYNGSGQVNTITRLGTGRWRVKFPGIGSAARAGVPGSGGIAHVVAYGLTAANC